MKTSPEQSRELRAQAVSSIKELMHEAPIVSVDMKRLVGEGRAGEELRIEGLLRGDWVQSRP